MTGFCAGGLMERRVGTDRRVETLPQFVEGRQGCLAAGSRCQAHVWIAPAGVQVVREGVSLPDRQG